MKFYNVFLFLMVGILFLNSQTHAARGPRFCPLRCVQTAQGTCICSPI